MKVNSTTILTAAAVAALTVAALASADRVGFTTSGVGGSPVTAPQPIDTPCGDIVLNQSVDPKTLGTGTVQCAGGSPQYTAANGLARSFPVDDALLICAVQFGIQTNIGGDWPLMVNLYSGDINGPFADLELRGSSEVLIPAGAGPEFFMANFEPVEFVAGESMIVELYHPSRNPDAGGDGGALWPGSNGSGQTAPSYIRAPECDFENFVDYAEIGFAAIHLTIKVFAQHGNGGPLPCHGDINGDGVVDVSDLLALLAAWGPCADPNNCPADINGDGVVDVTDLLALLSAWGDCPDLPGDSCVGNCGGMAPDGCYCDELCCELQDCCEDKHEACGGCEPPPATPRLNAEWGEGFTDQAHRDLATAALAWWDARIDQGKLEKLEIEFQYKDISLTWYDGTERIPLYPAGATLSGGPLADALITEQNANGKPTKGEIRFNSKYSWYVGTDPVPDDCDGDYDMWTVLKHEIAHVLGFNEFLAKYSNNVSQNEDGEWWYNEDGEDDEPKARLAGGHTGGKSHTHPTAHADDLMNETLPACHRRDDKDLTASILNHGIWDPDKE
jgi:hypothetical protein